MISTAETIALLSQVQGTIEGYKRQRKELTKTSGKAGETNRARLDRELAELESDHARRLREEELGFETAKNHLNSFVAARKSRVAAAFGNARTARLGGITKVEDREKYLIQKGVLDAERRETTLVEALQAERAHFEKSVAEQHGDLVALGAELRAVFRPLPWLLPILGRSGTLNPQEAAMEHTDMLSAATGLRNSARNGIAQLRRSAPMRIFRWLPIFVVVPLGLAAALGMHFFGDSLAPGMRFSGLTALECLAGYVVANLATALWIRKRAVKIAEEASKAAAFETNAPGAFEGWITRETARIRSETESGVAEFNRKWLLAIDDASAQRQALQEGLTAKRDRALGRLNRIAEARRQALESAHTRTMNDVARQASESKQALVSEHEQRSQSHNARATADYNSFNAATRATLEPLLLSLREATAAQAEAFQNWNTLAKAWTPPSEWKVLIPVGSIGLARSASNAELAEVLSGGDSAVSGPLSLDLAHQSGLLVEADKEGRATAMTVLNDLIFRILTSAPAGRVALTIFDPVALGQSFPALPRLADFDSKILNGQIWTRPEHLDLRLSELNQHIERVIQVCLRDEYANIFEYNKAAGNITERLHFLVLADFPTGLSDAALRLLTRIVSAGPRCGVLTLLHHNGSLTDAASTVVEQLRATAISLKVNSRHALVENQPAETTVIVEAPPTPQEALRLLEAVARASVGAAEVRVPFAEIAPASEQVWTRNVSEELRVAIGRAGPNKFQELALGKGTRQHALIAGKTGSGKSTLFHVIITNLALWCSPDEVEFYLIDFKKGIEFKSYATHQLPHARVVAIESDREFGLSVLQRIDQELRRRGELFRNAGVQDLPGYRRTGKTLPRTLLLIDEFQEFFTEDDRIAQGASMLLDRIVRQGRAFGIHVILGSQTLGGAYTLARSTLGQMVVRIALQSNEADANLIMDEGNSAARLLSRPGEGIYNDRGGSADANSAFQAVWLSEEEREQRLAAIQDRITLAGSRGRDMFVFEGNAPGDARNNRLLTELLRDAASAALRSEDSRIWLGEPNSIKGPTEISFGNRSGSNLLIVGQAEEAAATMLAVGLLALAHELRGTAARFVLIDGSRTDAPSHELFKDVRAVLPPGTEIIAPPLNVAMRELEKIAENENGEPVFVLLHNAQNIRELKIQDDFSFSSAESSDATRAPEILTKLLTDGPRRGIHTLISVDTATNASRFIGRKNIAECEMRVLFQMNANDSAALCDDPIASNLGLHKAALYRAESGIIEIFRPYSRPDFAQWRTDIHR